MPAHDRIWLQNTKVTSRIFREIQAQKPKALFFNGDMIMGYTADRHRLDREYAYWRGMISGLLETGTYVVPVPGNHEMQEKFIDENGKLRKIARVSNENAWRGNMGDLILNTDMWRELVGADIQHWNVDNAPAIGSADGIKSDQKQLSYSFDFNQLHFAVINTDAYSQDTHAPVRWLAQDLAKARDRGVKRIFVFGHKPAFSYDYNDKKEIVGFDTYPENQQAFWTLIEDYKATYFCGHQHLYHAMQPWKARNGRAWQFIVGSGGTPFDVEPGASKNPNDRMYAWANVTVHHSGKVHVDIWGFDDRYGKTKRLEQFDV